MSESEKPPSNTPVVLVLILAMFGLATLPQGARNPPDSPPRPTDNGGFAGGPSDPSEDEERLGPLAAIKADKASRGQEVFDDRIPRSAVAPASTGGTQPGRDDSQERREILESEHDLGLLIALVPDPDTTSMSHDFDLTLSAVQRGTESAGFVAVRWSGMPGFPPTKGTPPPAPKPPASRLHGNAGADSINLTIEDKPDGNVPALWPAAILCRDTVPTTSRKTHLLILLVPESPTWGVDKRRLTCAIELVLWHKELHKDCRHTTSAEDLSVRIIGPNYSGSAQSMIQVLKPFAKRLVRPDGASGIVVYNGNASAVDPLKFRDSLIRFESTIYSNRNVTSAVCEFIREITPWWAGSPRFAILQESNTTFGQRSARRRAREGTPKQAASQAPNGDTDYFGFPLNISQIREEYATKGYLGSKEPLKLQSPERLTPLEMAGRHGDRDLVPVVTPAPSAVGGEMSLSQLLMALERGRYTWVGINATNRYDRLFLAEKVREACPNARLFFVGASTLFAHHTAVPYLRGTLVASPYPLDPDTQSWTASPGAINGERLTRLAFGTFYEQGIYNATVAHLADMRLDDTPGLLDYAYPGSDPTTEAETEALTVPSVWISVVGQRGIYPLRVRPPGSDWSDVGGLYRFKKGRWARPDDRGEVLDASWIGVYLTAAFASIIASLWYLWLRLGPTSDAPSGWPQWACVRPGLRQIVDHHSALKLVTVGASAGFGQMVLLSAPVWALALPGSLVPVGPHQHSLLTILAVLALLLSSLAAVTALVRMVIAGGAKNVGAGEVLYRTIAVAIALVQIALPSYLLARLLGSDAAGLRLYCARVTRLVNGVTPVVPFLLLGLTGGIVMIGDWRRVGLRIRLKATGEPHRSGLGPLAEVWERFESARRDFDFPILAWGGAGFLKTLPLWVFLCLIGMTFADGLPLAVEPYAGFHGTFLLAFTLTLLLLVVRMLDLFGLSRVLDLLLRRLAEAPLARAFDRIPAHFAHESFWRPNSVSKRAEEDSDPRIDRQFNVVVVAYKDYQRSVHKDDRFLSGDTGEIDRLIANDFAAARLPTRDWWPVVGALTPFLAPYWSVRTAIPRAASDDASEWADLSDDNLKRWLTSAEDLIAMVIVRQIAWLRAAITSILSFLVAGLVMMSLVLTSYPFEPKGPMFALLGALTFITVGAIVVIAVQASRDEVLSRLNKTVSDRFTLDRQFVTAIVTFVVPLLGLLGALSYSISDLFRSLLEPLFRSN
jgi:hypothetical protein